MGQNLADGVSQGNADLMSSGRHRCGALGSAFSSCTMAAHLDLPMPSVNMPAVVRSQRSDTELPATLATQQQDLLNFLRSL